MYALSARRTGSCRLDEEQELAVYVLHPAAAHDRFIPAMRGFWTTAKEVIFMLIKQFKDSYRELKNLSTLVMTALLIAVGIVLGYFSIQLTDSIKIGVSFVATQLTATLFGPVVGGIMGGVADILKFIMKPTGAFFWGWTFNAVLGPVIYGIMLYKKKLTLGRILLSKAVVAVVVNMFFGCLWSSMLYGKGFFALLPAKFIQQLVQVPVQSMIFYLLVKALQKARVFRQLSR